MWGSREWYLGVVSFRAWRALILSYASTNTRLTATAAFIHCVYVCLYEGMRYTTKVGVAVEETEKNTKSRLTTKHCPKDLPQNLPKDRKLALVGIIPNQILFSFSSDKDRRTDSRIRRKNTAQSRRESNPGSCEF